MLNFLFPSFVSTSLGMGNAVNVNRTNSFAFCFLFPCMISIHKHKHDMKGQYYVFSGKHLFRVMEIASVKLSGAIKINV